MVPDVADRVVVSPKSKKLMALVFNETDNESFVSCRRSQIYHSPWCRDAQKISPRNLVTYETAPPGKHLYADCPR